MANGKLTVEEEEQAEKEAEKLAEEVAEEEEEEEETAVVEVVEAASGQNHQKNTKTPPQKNI